MFSLEKDQGKFMYTLKLTIYLQVYCKRVSLRII